MNDICFSKQVPPYEIFRIDKHEGATVTPAPQEMIERGSLPSDKKGKVRAISFLSVLYLSVHSYVIRVYTCILFNCYMSDIEISAWKL
jgi:hypothetical protein